MQLHTLEDEMKNDDSQWYGFIICVHFLNYISQFIALDVVKRPNININDYHLELKYKIYQLIPSLNVSYVLMYKGGFISCPTNKMKLY